MNYVDYNFVVRHNDAVRGSEMLRDAILTAKGHPIPEKSQRIIAKAAIKQITLAPVCCDKCGSPVSPDRRLVSHIQATVAGYFGLHLSAMTTARRGHSMAHPRQIAMYLASELTPKSLPEIGRRFGGRDHTTVIHAIKAVNRRIADDPEIAEDVRILRAVLAA